MSLQCWKKSYLNCLPFQKLLTIEKSMSFSPTFFTRLVARVCCRCSVTSHPRSHLIPHPHLQLTQATRCIDVRCDAEYGRYVVANDVIARGDVIIAEKPFAAVLLPDQCETHCDRCFGKLTQVFYPWDDWLLIFTVKVIVTSHVVKLFTLVSFTRCHHCTLVRYCSPQCHEIAWQRYHYIECTHLPQLHQVRFILFCFLDFALFPL